MIRTRRLTAEEEATVVMAAAHLDDEGIREVLAWARSARRAQVTGELLALVLKGVVAPTFVHGKLAFDLTPTGEVFAKGGMAG